MKIFLLKIDLLTQIISSDQTIRSNTVQDSKEFTSQSLATQAGKRKQLDSLMPANKKGFDLMGDDICELFTINDALKSKFGSYDKKWLEGSKQSY